MTLHRYEFETSLYQEKNSNTILERGNNCQLAVPLTVQDYSKWGENEDNKKKWDPEDTTQEQRSSHQKAVSTKSNTL